MSQNEFLKNLPIERKLVLVMIIPLVTLGILSLATYRSVQTFSDDEELLNHVYLVQMKAAEYLRLIVDLETGFRGYVLTGNQKFLQPYQVAKTKVVEVGQQLQSLVKDREAQAILIEEVQVLVSEFLAEKEAFIRQIQSGEINLVIAYEEGKGRALMTSIRNVMTKFDRREVQLLKAALITSSRDRTFLILIVLGGGMVALIFLLVPIHFIARSITEPLVAIAKTVGSVKGGVIPSVTVLNRNDEIGDLSRVIAGMSSQLREHIRRLEESEAELRRVNQELASSEAKYRGIVDNAPIGIFSFLASSEARLLFSNQCNQKLAGLSHGDEGHPAAMWNAIHPEDRKQVESEIAYAVNHHVPYEGAFRFLHSDGEIRKILCRAIPIDDSEGNRSIYQGFNVDITTFEQMRERLGRAERLATLGQVAAGIAHEIRNPLVGVGATASLLISELPENSPYQQDLATILNETNRLDRIVNQVVDFARPRSFSPAPFDIEELIHETIALLKQSLQKQHVGVEMQKPDGLPLIEADRDQIKQVLVNVLQNAIESLTSRGQLTISLKNIDVNHEPGILIRVTDNGMGIKETDLPHIFEPFFTKGKATGTGLGLAICRNIIDLHRGEMKVNSQENVGTTLSIWLPLVQPTEVFTT